MSACATFILLSLSAFSQNRLSLYQKPISIPSPQAPKAKAANKSKRGSNQDLPSEPGNLPQYYMGRTFASAEESPIVLPNQKQAVPDRSLGLGEVVKAEIKESLIAFGDGKAPVRAFVSDGKLKNSVLVGEATMEKNSKRILITFTKLRTSNTHQILALTGSALDSRGILGIEGKLVSEEEKYFLGEFLAAGAAGYTDSTVDRAQNTFGNFVEVPTADTFSKKALGSALAKTADHFSEKLKQAPEYALLEGPIEIQVLITEAPTITN